MENNKVKVATGGIAEELKKMEVGDTVSFPLPKYKYNSVRSATCTGSIDERVVNGKRWKTNLDSENKLVNVTRTA